MASRCRSSPVGQGELLAEVDEEVVRIEARDLFGDGLIVDQLAGGGAGSGFTGLNALFCGGLFRGTKLGFEVEQIGQLPAQCSAIEESLLAWPPVQQGEERPDLKSLDAAGNAYKQAAPDGFTGLNDIIVE